MRDLIGVELPDLDAVREEANRRAFLLLSEGYRKGEDRRGHILFVRDEDGRVVLKLTLGDAIAYGAL